MDKKFAVFVDGDNICAKDYEPIIKEIRSTYGEILIKKVYGDWTTPNMNKWKDVLIKEPATPCQQFRSGKNATDTRIIMDAIEMMIHNANITAFCIVSTDADFYGLALRLRENGKFVLGIGKEQSNIIWREACNEFIKLESLTNKETGMLDKLKYIGVVKSERPKVKIIKRPDPTQFEKNNQQNKTDNLQLAV